MTGHSRNRRGYLEKSRCQLVRAKVGRDGSLSDGALSDGLLWKILSDLPELAPSLLLPPARGGLNIEGLAWDARHEHLIVGLRSPTFTQPEKTDRGMQELAIALRITNPHEMFDKPGTVAKLATNKVTGIPLFLLPLDGHGIRGLSHAADGSGFWVLSGLSTDPNHKVRDIWGLWHWDGKRTLKGAILPKDAQELRTPEAVCTATIDGAPYLLIVEDRDVEAPGAFKHGKVVVKKLAQEHQGCPYLLLPTKKLSFQRPQG